MDPSLLYDYIEYRYVQQSDGTQKHMAVCPECRKVFAAVSIEEHIRRMHEQREIECNIVGCDFTSLVRNHMNEHVKQVHGDGRWRCNYEGCTYAAGDKSSLAKHKDDFHNHVPRQQMLPYHRIGPVDVEERRMVPLDTRYRPIPATRTPSPTRQASTSTSRPRSRVGRIANRVNPGTDIGSRARDTTSANSTVTAPIAAPVSVPSFARPGEIPSATPTSRANDDWFLSSGSATASSSSRSSSPTRRDRGRGRVSMADSAPHEIPQLVTPKEYQATFGFIRKPRD